MGRCEHGASVYNCLICTTDPEDRWEVMSPEMPRDTERMTYTNEERLALGDLLIRMLSEPDKYVSVGDAPEGGMRLTLDDEWSVTGDEARLLFRAAAYLQAVN